MKIQLIFLSIILANVLQAQTTKLMSGDFDWEDKESVYLMKLKFEENGKFELIQDSYYDCTPAYVNYGRGEYQILEDSILLVFDSIPTLKSTCQIDSIGNTDEYSNLSITVVNQNGEKMQNVALHWGKPKKWRKRTRFQFFEAPFDDAIALKFENNETINFVRIEKEGFYPCKINIPKHPNKDYIIEVVLRPEPVQSRYYTSNLKAIVAVLSECEIQYFNGRTLKKKSCD